MDVGATQSVANALESGLGLFIRFVAIFARIHPSLKESHRLDDSDDFDKPAVARPVR